MKSSKVFYKRIEKMLPKAYANHIKKMMIYSGIKLNYKEWIGFFFSYSLAIGITVSLVLGLLNVTNYLYSALIGLGVFVVIQIFSEVLLSLSVYSRTKFIEKMLPEFLSLLSSNVKSGLTIDQSFLLSIRDEFGNFKEDISRASKDTLTGVSFTQALMNMTENISSKAFEKTINLIVEGVNSGGNISTLLDNIVEDMREMQLLKKEMKAGVTMYTLILVIASCVGAPALYGIALYEVETLQSFMSVIPEGQDYSAYTGLNFNSSSAMDVGVIQIIAAVSLVINAIFGALMIGLLESGKTKEGIKLVPILIGVSLLIFFGVSFVVKAVFPVF